MRPCGCPVADLRAVVVGYGYAGRVFHSHLIVTTPGLALHGVASRDPRTRDRIVSERGCKAYDGVDAVFADPDVDLVVLATPNNTHAALAIRALEAGKHVVTEKAMCLNLEECDRMIIAARKAGKMLTVFQNRRWDGDFLTVRQLVREGRLGRVRWIEMAWQKFGAPTGWRGRAEMGGGRLYDLGAHLVDQLLLLFPQPVRSVYCRMSHDFEDTDVESHATIVVGFDGGATGICDLSSMAAISKPRFNVLGTEATFVKYGFDPQEEAAKAGDVDSAAEREADYGRLHNGRTETVVPTRNGRWRAFYENVVNVLTRGEELAVSLVEARRVVGVLDAARQAARSNRVIELDLQARRDLESPGTHR